MCNIVLPAQNPISRKDARDMLKKSIRETQELNTSLREGTWKPDNKVEIVTSTFDNRSE